MTSLVVTMPVSTCPGRGEDGVGNGGSDDDRSGDDAESFQVRGEAGDRGNAQYDDFRQVCESVV